MRKFVQFLFLIFSSWNIHFKIPNILHSLDIANCVNGNLPVLCFFFFCYFGGGDFQSKINKEVVVVEVEEEKDEDKNKHNKKKEIEKKRKILNIKIQKRNKIDLFFAATKNIKINLLFLAKQK